MRTVQDLARHADPRTTMMVYTRSRMTVKEGAVEKLRETLTGGISHKNKSQPKLDLF